MKVLVSTRRSIATGTGAAVYALIGAMTLVGCGSPSSTNPNGPTVSGVVSSASPLAGTVALKDVSQPAVERTAPIGADGSFAIDAAGLTPPYLLKAQSKDAAGTTTVMYSGATDAGRTNINPITTAAVAAASSDGADDVYRSPDSEGRGRTVRSFESVVVALEAKLKPLFDLYGVPANPFTDDGPDAALRAMLQDVRFTVTGGRVVVTNKLTGAVIFYGPLSNLDAGTFTPANMPAGPSTTPPPTPTPIDGAALYAASCAGCHGALPGSKAGASAAAIQAAITTNKGGMGSLSSLTAAQIDAIAAAMVPTTPAPTTCSSFTYSTWGACQSSGTQTRTVIASSPSGCTGGTPVLSQGCTYVPPVTTCTSFTYSAWGACQSNGTQTRTVTASSPSGCTGGTPVLSQGCTYVPPVNACTSFTYSAWGACQSNGTQSRTVTASSPSGCTGGTPVLSQGCTYTPPACTYTYSAWGACQSSGTQTRTVTASSPSGCTGTPVLSQGCTYTPPIDGTALYNQYCSGCHGNAKKGSSVTAIQGAIASNRGGMGSLSFLTAAQIQAISAAP